jgi:hypothetical protein
VSDTIGHKRLRAEYGVETAPPNKLSDQWEVIKTIGTHSPTNPWQCKILIFPKDWLDKRNNDIGWLRFHNYLLIKSWIQSKYMRSKSELSILWEAFASAIRARNLKPNPYILDNIMHNIFLANGAIPGFIPADSSELLLPSLSIEYAYEAVYMLKEYAPIVMHPWRFGEMGSSYPIYYSLAYPTMLEGSPAIRQAPSVISEMRDIMTLMQTLEKIMKKHSALNYDLIKEVAFQYFHTEEDKFGEIEDSKNIMTGDPNLIQCVKRFKSKVFPYQGPFFRGVIRISRKD